MNHTLIQVINYIPLEKNLQYIYNDERIYFTFFSLKNLKQFILMKIWI
jgi:hypothetical protein